MADQQCKTIHEVRRWASLFLEKYGREPGVVEILLQHHLGMSRAQLLATERDAFPSYAVDNFTRDVKKHAETAIPVQHLTGRESFYGRDYFVDKHVLIPRPETEELVLGVIDYVKAAKLKNPPRIVDVGTGSGVIAITLKLELGTPEVCATDLSEEALTVARRNAESLEADVTFTQGDFLKPLVDNKQAQVDIIVSNPPYIAYEEQDALSDTVKNYDPELALFAEEEGLAAYKQILAQARSVISKNALIAFEIGHMQGNRVQALISAYFPDSVVDVRQDINGKDRIVFAEVDHE